MIALPSFLPSFLSSLGSRRFTTRRSLPQLSAPQRPPSLATSLNLRLTQEGEGVVVAVAILVVVGVSQIHGFISLILVSRQ
ncbi:hypothetical protein E2C01_042034 [Portunus trituberculatus]|uniref:Uncharacterized protein n=1 Tax=Portunus trituberculatus TaxID=210409 RepID=A0A5B7FRY1_PORTR|nr:hypothetical protein [Portunus trituberculatus]